MASSGWQDFIDAVFIDLTANVAGLADVIEHRYSPFDPEELAASAGQRHLSVFPVADAAEEAVPIVTAPGGDQLTTIYRVLYWEAADESARGVSNTQAAADLLELAEDTRNRFYKLDNLRMGGSSSVRYIGAAFPDRSGQVRWFALGVRATREIVAT